MPSPHPERRHIFQPALGPSQLATQTQASSIVPEGRDGWCAPVGLERATAQQIFQDTTVALTSEHGFDLAWFGERRAADELVVGYRSGAVSEISNSTLLRPGLGLGGLVFASNTIQFVDNYLESREITHHYDEKIKAESIKRIIGVPVSAGGECFGVLMVGSRVGGSFGNRAGVLMEAAARRMSDALLAAILRARLAAFESAAKATEAQLRALEARAAGPGCNIRARERDVLERVALGYTNREIAATMQLSECTVKSYLRNVMQRLGARNRTEAIACARSAGLL